MSEYCIDRLQGKIEESTKGRSLIQLVAVAVITREEKRERESLKKVKGKLFDEI